MLERIEKENIGSQSLKEEFFFVDSSNKKVPVMRFDKIKKFSQGEGICYVRSGVHKRTRAEKPYITLYVADVNGVVIPAYLFEIGDFIRSGKDLSTIIGRLVCIEWEENYLSGIGLTLTLNKVSVVENPTVEQSAMFIGVADKLEERITEIQDVYKEITGHAVKLPFLVRTVSHIDYDNGKVGGLVSHYYKLQKTLCAMESSMDREQYIILHNTLMLYIVVHLYYVNAENENAVDIKLVSSLTSTISKILPKLETTDGILEIIHVFFGYEPKDVYIRMIVNFSKSLLHATKEINTHNATPEDQDGNAGFGTIHRYAVNIPE